MENYKYNKNNKDCWKIIDSYFNSVPRCLSVHQLDSFNMFLSNKLIGMKNSHD